MSRRRGHGQSRGSVGAGTGFPPVGKCPPAEPVWLFLLHRESVCMTTVCWPLFTTLLDLSFSSILIPDLAHITVSHHCSSEFFSLTVYLTLFEMPASFFLISVLPGSSMIFSQGLGIAALSINSSVKYMFSGKQLRMEGRETELS